MKTTGNTILITGGTSGIGLELTKQLLERGNTIIVTGRDTKKLDETKKRFSGLHTIASDVSRTGDIEKLVTEVTTKFPKLNWLISNAGIMNEINLHEDVTLEQLTREIEINLMGPIRMTRAFLAHLKTQPSAAIVNVTSGLAFTPLPSSPVYCATKAGLHSFTLSLRVQLKKTAIKVFELAPPATETPLLADANPEDMKGISVMKVDAMVAEGIKGFEADKFEICPGQSKQLRMMSRVAPGFILSQMSKPVDRMLSQ